MGKQGGRHTLPQDEINSLIVKRAKEGKIVARLKGGDPFIFGRGGEEAEELVDNGIPFEIVPGVTAATAVPTYAGIPLTHRDHTASVAFVTGHEDPTKEESKVHWDKIATGIGTLVFFMGMKNLSEHRRKSVSARQEPGNAGRAHPVGHPHRPEGRDRHAEGHRRQSEGQPSSVLPPSSS